MGLGFFCFKTTNPPKVININMYLYFIRMGRLGPIKIGVAGNVKQRLKTLQTGNPEELSIITSVKCDSDMKTLDLERRLHKIYQRHRIRGEWFRGDIKLSIADNVLKTFHIEEDHKEKIETEEADQEILSNIPECF